MDLIPTMYLASSCEAAIAESVFHDVVATGKTEFFDLRPFTNMHYIQLQLERDLNVVSCRAQDCLYMGIDRDELIGTNTHKPEPGLRLFINNIITLTE